MPSHSSSSPYYYNASVDDQTFDDACDLGQFCLNPCWFLFCKASNIIENYNNNNATSSSTSKKKKKVPQGDDPFEEMMVTTTTMSSSSVSSSVTTTPTTSTPPTNGKTLWYQQGLYITLVYGTWCIIFAKVFPLCASDNAILPYWSTVGMGTVLFVACVVSYVVAKFSSPGVITSETIAKYDNYPYDNVLYVQQTTDDATVVAVVCPTTGIVKKLARSKYDKYKHLQHIPRYDHYCGWLHQAIGEENYRYFITFLFIHTFMCWYGFVAVYITIWNIVHNGFVSNGNSATAGTTTAIVGLDTAMFSVNVLKSILWFDGYITVALAVLFVMSFLLTTFLGFHCFLICNGMTTNEYYKWKVVHERAYNNNHNTRHATISSSSSVPIKNLYNLGLLANWYEVFFPRSLRRQVKASTTTATIKSIKHL